MPSPALAIAAELVVIKPVPAGLVSFTRRSAAIEETGIVRE